VGSRNGELKERSVTSCKLWKEAGRPRSGPIFNRYRSDKSAYRHGIRSRQREKTEVRDTNDLHEALLRKQGTHFWKWWKSKFECTDRPISYINGINDVETIAEHFAAHFSRACTSNSTVGADRLKKEYLRLKHSYTVNSRTGQTPQRIFVDSLKNADLRRVCLSCHNYILATVTDSTIHYI